MPRKVPRVRAKSMNSFEQCVIPESVISEEPNEICQKWEEPFQQLMDEIYWPGYSQHLLEINSNEYAREFFYFRVLYV